MLMLFCQISDIEHLSWFGEAAGMAASSDPFFGSLK